MSSYSKMLNPIGDKAAPDTAISSSKRKGRAKPVIGLLNNSKPNVEFFLGTLEAELRKDDRYDIFNIVKSRSAAPCADIDLMVENCDYVINAVADCGSCTSWSVHDAIELEKRGVPTISVVTDVFLELATEVASSLGSPDINTVTIAHPLGELKRSEVTERGKKAFPEVLNQLFAPRPARAKATEQRIPRLLDISGSWEEINDYFYNNGWSDGLPIAPPTQEKVAAMLRGSATDPDRVIGIIPPRMGMATAEKIAVNAVMAGCQTEYFPVVLAAIKAICSPEFNLLPMQATTNPVTPMIIVNGPIVAGLGINSGYNVLGQGWRSNTSIGRAVRSILTNIGGGTPGKLDKACQGQPGKFSMCIAENVESSPWKPFHVEKGFAESDSTVSVIGVTGTQDIVHYARTNAQMIFDTIINAIPKDGYKNIYSGGQPLLLMGPEQAAIVGREGYSKRDVKRIIFEGTKIPVARFIPEIMQLIRGRRTDLFDGSTQVTHIPIADSADDIQLAVAGAAGNHSVFIPSWGDTRCVTVKI